MSYLNDTRKEYSKYTFDQSQAFNDPFDQFVDWFEFAKKNAVFEPNAMSLTTCMNNRPTNRIVLLKQYSKHGYVFFTNYNSKKSQEMIANPLVALTFYWPNIERQIRIEGTVKKLPESESDDYFNTRPRDSQLSAWASAQSSRVGDRNELNDKLLHFNQKYPNTIPRPPFWGGFCVVPNFYEFWQGRENRTHDRICYEHVNDKWVIYRLCP